MNQVIEIQRTESQVEKTIDKELYNKLCKHLKKFTSLLDQENKYIEENKIDKIITLQENKAALTKELEFLFKESEKMKDLLNTKQKAHIQDLYTLFQEKARINTSLLENAIDIGSAIITFLAKHVEEQERLKAPYNKQGGKIALGARSVNINQKV